MSQRYIASLCELYLMSSDHVKWNRGYRAIPFLDPILSHNPPIR
ncbi:hypothetical protein NPIL_643191, partial [Nephila pilipes]